MAPRQRSHTVAPGDQAEHRRRRDFRFRRKPVPRHGAVLLDARARVPASRRHKGGRVPGDVCQPLAVRAGQARASAQRALPRGCARRAQARGLERHHRAQLRLAREHQGAGRGENGGGAVERAAFVPRRRRRRARAMRRLRRPRFARDKKGSHSRFPRNSESEKSHHDVPARGSAVQLRGQPGSHEPGELLRRRAGSGGAGASSRPRRRARN